jgi:(4S)-4-hydroxy-5-phosphonooxypentane-2,3-dione isomerase
MIRIVKLNFKAEHRRDFLDLLENHKSKIRSFPGCSGVDFLNDIADPNLFFTYSRWDNEESLNEYRDSELFKTIWSKVKPWFDQKAEAWSVEEF